MESYFWFCVLVAVNSLLLVILAGYVSRLRYRYRISVGDNGNKHLYVAMRTHANGIEQVPTYALLILGLSFYNASELVLASLVIAFTLSRILHAVGMLHRMHLARRIGAGLTYLLQIIASGFLLFTVIS